MELFEMMEKLTNGDVIEINSVNYNGVNIITKELFYDKEERAFKLNYLDDLNKEDIYNQFKISEARVLQLLEGLLY